MNIGFYDQSGNRLLFDSDSIFYIKICIFYYRTLFVDQLLNINNSIMHLIAYEMENKET